MSVDLGGLPAMVWGSPPLKSLGGKQRSWKCQSLTLPGPCAAGMVKHMIHVQAIRCYMQWNGALEDSSQWLVATATPSIQHHQWQRGKLGLLDGSGIHAKPRLHHHADRYSGEASPPWSLLCISCLFCSFPDISVNHLTCFQYIPFLLKSAELVSVVCKLRTPTNAVTFHKNPNSFKDLSLAQVLSAYFWSLDDPSSPATN